jgi:hypothetical protein
MNALKLVFVVLLAAYCQTSFAQALYVSSGETVFISSGTTVSSTTGVTTIVSGGTLNVAGEYQSAGNFTNSGTLTATSGTLTFTGTGQSVSGNNATVKNVNIGSSASVTLTSALNIQGGSNYGTLTVSNGGTLNSAGYLTLKSDANGNAVVAAGSSSGSYISNIVTVERYIPARRAFRILSPSVTTSTSIYANWQEGGSSNASLGTHITGNSGSTNGFDNTATNNPSLFTFNNASGSNTDGSWTAVTNTNSNVLTAGSPLRILIRGDRSIDVSNSAPTPTVTTLRASGTLGQGNTTVSGLSQIANGFSLVGNPFPTPVNMKSVLDNATNVSNAYFYVWDPQVNTRGGYVTFDLSTSTTNVGSSDQTVFLQPGQSAFVKTSSNGSASLTFAESYKSTASINPGVFLTIPPQSVLKLELSQRDSFKVGGNMCDALILKFDPSMSNNLEVLDAIKPINQDENLSVFVSEKFCSIESRNIPQNEEVVDLRISQLRHLNYTVKAEFTGDLGLDAYLLDRFTNKTHQLNREGETIIEFDVDGSAESKANQRFALVFDAGNNSRVKSIQKSFKAYPNPVNGSIVQLDVFAAKIQSVEVFDLSGRYFGNLNSSSSENAFVVDTHLPNGTYVLRANTNEGQFSTTISLAR